jgi:hypothetical protein
MASSTATATSSRGLPVQPVRVAGRVVLRQAKALASCPSTTAANAAPEAVASRVADGSLPQVQPPATRTATNAAISTTASAGPSTPKDSAQLRRVDERPGGCRAGQDTPAGRFGTEREGG